MFSRLAYNKVPFLRVNFWKEYTLNVLLAEDDSDNARLLKFILTRESYKVDIACNGQEALKLIKEQAYDILMTDWLMPEMDGVELICQVRSQVKPAPLILMITAISSGEAKQQVLFAGADDFLGKPFGSQEVLKCLNNAVARWQQSIDDFAPDTTRVSPPKTRPAFPVIAFLSGAGGPNLYSKLFQNATFVEQSGLFLLQQGPRWMLELMIEKLQETVGLQIQFAGPGIPAKVSHALLFLEENSLSLDAEKRVCESKMENETFSSSTKGDDLLKSLAETFGPYSTAVILSGMGCDGIRGAACIKAAGGKVVVQDPDTALVDKMPQSVISAGLADEILPIEEISKYLSQTTANFMSKLA